MQRLVCRVAPLASRFCLLACVLAAVGCSTMTAARRYDLAASSKAGAMMERLASQRQTEERKLDALARSVRDLKAEEAAARHRAEQARCNATVENLKLEASLAASQCSEQLANAQACLAEEQKGRAKATAVGCGLGAAASVLGLGPFGLLFCFGSGALAEASDSRCPQPSCESSPDEALPTVLRNHDLSELPTCEVQQLPPASAAES